jgi:DNA-binding transcriptional MerR regulator
MDLSARWTLEELGDRVASALSVDYAGPANGQIRAVPDARTIRYYSTLGLIDRPAEMRGRTALYSGRHLAQLVAIKRLQAEGKALSEIQELLAGVPDAILARISKVAPPSTPAPETPATSTRRRAEFWREAPVIAQRSEAAARARPLELTKDYAGIALGENNHVILLLVPSRPIEAQDREAVLEAAAPLIEALKARGLISRLEGEDR